MPRCSTSLTLLATLAVVAAPSSSRAQLRPVPQDEGASGLGLALRRLSVAGRVLYVTAHPDDENNAVLVKLSRGLGLGTALLTLTRGEGGQNEIGPEIFEALGILRTEELAAVHRYDRAAQFFTRAYEFGYSFSVEETFEKWGREEILADVVRVIRSQRPDVILTLPLEAEGGGQHHQAAAILAREAFRAAADPRRFPGQIQEGLRPWQAAKIYQGGLGGGNEDIGTTGSLARVDTGDYDPLLGMTSFQFGRLARTAHKCQRAGQVVPLLGIEPGAAPVSLYRLLDSEPKVEAAAAGLFDGIDTTLGSITRFAPGEGFVAEGLRAIGAAALRAGASFDALAPQRTTPALADGLRAVRDLSSKVKHSRLNAAAKAEILDRLTWKEQDFVDALTLAQGLYVDAIADDGHVAPGQSFTVVARAWNRGAEPAAIAGVSLVVPPGWLVEGAAKPASSLAPGAFAEVPFTVTVPPTARSTRPYWKRQPNVDRYDIEVPEHFPLPWSPPEVTVSVTYEAAEARATVVRPAIVRSPGPWVGERQTVVNVVPALSVTLSPRIAVIPATTGVARREFRVRVLNNTKGEQSAVVRLEAPSGLTVEPGSAPLMLRFEGEQATARFVVTAPASARSGAFEVKAVVSAGGRTYAESYQEIAYDHIQERHLFHPASARLMVVDVRTNPGARIGYVVGSGDEVPAAIEQLGFPLTLLTADDLAYGDLSPYTTIVTGIRAYLGRSDLRASNTRLLDYATAGGNLVIQYNQLEFNSLAEPAAGMTGASSVAVSPFAPYPGAVSRARITDEEAPLRVLDPADELFSVPNAIAAADFAGWVQERGTYFFAARDERYKELLSGSDPMAKNPGEKKGILTEAAVGKGTWTYVGLGLWRQLPAGVPGAYRLLANLLSRPRGAAAGRSAKQPGHGLGDRRGRCQSRRVDPDERNEAGKAAVDLVADHEVARGIARSLELGSDAADVGHEVLVFDLGDDPPHRIREGGPAALVHAVILFP